MIQKVLRTLLLAISVLCAYLLISLLESWILDQPKSLGPELATLIGMTLIVFLFVPLFAWMDKASQKMVQTVSRIFSGTFGRTGFYIFLFATLGVLYLVYLYMWFNVRII